MEWRQPFPLQMDFPINLHWGLCLSSDGKSYSERMDFNPGPYNKAYGARDKSVQRGVKRSITLTSPPTLTTSPLASVQSWCWREEGNRVKHKMFRSNVLCKFFWCSIASSIALLWIQNLTLWWKKAWNLIEVLRNHAYFKTVLNNQHLNT